MLSFLLTDHPCFCCSRLECLNKVHFPTYLEVWNCRYGFACWMWKELNSLTSFHRPKTSSFKSFLTSRLLDDTGTNMLKRDSTLEWHRFSVSSSLSYSNLPKRPFVFILFDILSFVSSIVLVTWVSLLYHSPLTHSYGFLPNMSILFSNPYF